MENLNVEVRFYDLLPEQRWEADLEQMRGHIDAKTKAILVNSPSNPTGQCFSLEH
jgi:tyrosine aminotransferase